MPLLKGKASLSVLYVDSSRRLAKRLLHIVTNGNDLIQSTPNSLLCLSIFFCCNRGYDCIIVLLVVYSYPNGMRMVYVLKSRQSKHQAGQWNLPNSIADFSLSGISSLSQEMTQQHHQIMCCYCNSKEIEGKTETISRLQSIKLRPGNNKSWILPHIEVPLSSGLFRSPMVTNEP